MYVPMCSPISDRGSSAVRPTWQDPAEHGYVVRQPLAGVAALPRGKPEGG
jgi:hypothetical protein